MKRVSEAVKTIILLVLIVTLLVVANKLRMKQKVEDSKVSDNKISVVKRPNFHTSTVESKSTFSEKDLDKLINAIAHVESTNGKYLFGDYNTKKYSERDIKRAIRNKDIVTLKKIDPALGKFQIHWRYWKDGCRILGVDWPYTDSMDSDKAEMIVRAYLTTYGNLIKSGPNMKDLALIHNGGPKGYEYKSNPYWNRIKKYL